MTINDTESQPAATPENPAAPDVNGLRAEIDRIDDALAQLVARRMAASGALAVAKPADRLPLRPAREAQVLRRLIAAAPESVPPEVIVEVWRALMGASARRQQPFDVVVASAGAADMLRLFDIARRHFGAGAKILRAEDARAAFLRVLEPSPCVAVAPAPAASGPGLWWPIFSESRFHGLQIVAALAQRATWSDAEAVVIARNVPLEAAGQDTTFCLAFDPHYRLARALSDLGVAGREVARARTLILLTLDGFVTADDPRLTGLARAGLDGVRIVGSTARV
jgi:chorismate mutase